MTPKNIYDPDPGGVMTPENIFDPDPGGVLTPVYPPKGTAKAVPERVHLTSLSILYVIG